MFLRSMKDNMVLPHHMEELMRLTKKAKFVDDYEVKEGKHPAVWFLNPAEFASKLNNFFAKVSS